MSSIEVQFKDATGKDLETLQVDPEALGGRLRMRLMREAVLVHRAATRVGTASTKRRGERAGTTAKMYRQKHTGRARAGSRRATQRRGGGRPFGPRPRDYSLSIPRKARKLATKSALLGKFMDGEVIVVDSLSFDAPKTAQAAGVLKALNIYGDSCLVVIDDYNDNVYKSFRNIDRVSVMPVKDLNTYDILTHARLVMTKAGFDLVAGGSNE
jgi:large subunit ribosomal protein L4